MTIHRKVIHDNPRRDMEREILEKDSDYCDLPIAWSRIYCCSDTEHYAHVFIRKSMLISFITMLESNQISLI